MSVELVVRDTPVALFDEPFAVRAKARDGGTLLWRARYRDDDDRVWRAAASTPEGLVTAWEASKPGTGPAAALQSLRPVSVDVRVETPDGQAASRTLTRHLRAAGVRSRRWRDGLQATLHLPVDPEAVAPLVLDASEHPEIGALAGPLLASRGVLTLVVTGGGVDAALERLAAVPSAAGAPRVASGLVLPPNVGTREGGAAERVAAWDALLAEAGARPRAGARDDVAGRGQDMSDESAAERDQKESKEEGIARGGQATPPPPGGGAEKGDSEPDPKYPKGDD